MVTSDKMTSYYDPSMFLLLLLLLLYGIDRSNAFLPSSSSHSPRSEMTTIHQTDNNNNNNNNNNSKDNAQEEDWRAFRAKLVQTESSSSSASSSWTYDAGMLIEKGSLVVSKVEDSLGCHDLRQPYFAKCVVLLLEHDESDFTQGIILNRPSNLNLKDQDIVYQDDDGNPVFAEDEEERNNNNSWRMFYGGDISGLYDESPLIVCLHNDASEMAQSVSDEIMPGVYLTSHLGARALVEEGTLTPEDCFIFYGFCEWDPGQLELEVKRGSWSIVSVDSTTMWNDLSSQRKPDNDPRRVGLDMWNRIIKALDSQQQDNETDEIVECREEQRQQVSEFQDLMLKEWATKLLMVPQMEKDETFVEDADIYQAIRAAGQTIETGALLRGSSQEESPFLLQDQFLHKSTILMLQELDDVSIGVALHLPSSDAIDFDLSDGTCVKFPVRYGGLDGRGDEDPFLWFFCGEETVGQALGTNISDSDYDEGCVVQTCSYKQVIESLEAGVASPHDFLLVKGFCLWQKGEDGSGGIKGEVIDGKFEPISSDYNAKLWSSLARQEVNTEESLPKNFQGILDAWEEGSGQKSETDDISISKGRLVFESSKDVTKLSDDALLVWMKLFLLGYAEYHR